MTGGQPIGSAGPRIVVLSGPSGTGKTTVVKRLIETVAVPIAKAVTATTRRPRPGETDGRDYHFLSPAEFRKTREEGRFLETAEVFGTGTWYGTPRSEVERAQRQGVWCLLEIDVRGALEIKRQFDDAVMIFLQATSIEEYESRLRQRRTETEEAIRSRLDRMREELRFADRYEFQVVNDDVDRAVAEIGAILQRREAERNA
ncbi:MAG: guanylate kinase [Planctomycetaceae bacterium]